MTDLHGFELLKAQDIPELNTTARLWRHKQTGAELLSMENQDENKVFGITFRTPPEDSTGIAHIMEHSVPCGSEKYPLKEPFIELVKGSLKTFLNAFTYPDKTCYPVASQNLQDFYNLIDVYVDAVFHPLIPEHTLQQEGWHYELESLEDELIFKGVVFNEMKGSFSNPDRVLEQFKLESVYPDNTYGLNSGGDPKAIPDLTYTQFKEFYATNYHPSNARIYMYGDDDPAERLRLMNTYLSGFEKINVKTQVALQPRFDEPGRVTKVYDAGQDAGEKKSMLAVNWMLPENDDPELVLGMGILAHILVGTPASPLRKALIDSGLGEDLVAGGLEDELRQLIFSTGLKGIASADADKVEGLVLETLAALVKDGIDAEMVAAALNTVEFRLRENNAGQFPQGLLLMLRALTTWLHDGDPFAPLAFEQPLAAIKARLANGEAYFESLIRDHFLENTHRVTLLLEPDAELRAREDAAEEARLAAARASMSEAQLQVVVENTLALKKLQDTPDSPEALASLPALTLADLDTEIRTIPLEEQELDGCRVFYHDLFTNGLLYLDIGFNLHSLPQEYLPYAGLFGQTLLEMGTDSQDFVQLSQRIGRDTGGIYPSNLLAAVRDADQSAAWMFLRGKATAAQADKLLGVLRDVLLTTQLDNQERFRQIVLEEKAGQEASLTPSGHMVVNTRLASKFSEAGWADEQTGGVSYLFFLRQLVEAIDKDWPGVLAQLEKLRTLLLNRNAMLCNVTVDAGNWQAVQPQLADFVAAMPSADFVPASWTRQAGPEHEGLSIPAQVNYVGKGSNLYQSGFQRHGSALVINRFLATTWLWEKVRVQGGAYGGFSTFDANSGVFNFLSYRDPNLLDTLQTYDGTPGFLRELDLSPSELTRSIVGAIGQLDAYQLPDAKGFSSLRRSLTGIDDAFRQQGRAEVLATTAADFKAFADALDAVKQNGQVVVLGSAQDIESANDERGAWLDVKKVL
ncbi:MAG: insulinase family protein [Anaerolineae bacterium]|nr:insulinase family protein [Anaerolineae bacterium]